MCTLQYYGKKPSTLNVWLLDGFIFQAHTSQGCVRCVDMKWLSQNCPTSRKINVKLSDCHAVVMCSGYWHQNRLLDAFWRNSEVRLKKIWTAISDGRMGLSTASTTSSCRRPLARTSCCSPAAWGRNSCSHLPPTAVSLGQLVGRAPVTEAQGLTWWEFRACCISNKTNSRKQKKKPITSKARILKQSKVLVASISLHNSQIF